MKEICKKFNIDKIPNKKGDLVAALLKYRTEVIENLKYIEMCKNTVLTPEMNKCVTKLFSWFKNEKMYLSGGICANDRLQKDEVYYIFSQYNPQTDEHDNGNLEKSDKQLFLDMFFDKLGTEWEYYPLSDDDDYYEDFEYYEKDFLAFMNK